ncbi:hypothetical protein [Streptomyces sp. NBC_01237]|uniref:hypothetical protein n=1 Tax=Streptomyces sp. NBC_01237 TaxID=2903790 RepID=UPI002DDC1149|nr:hypothetical protein [Streptomyces sp. NBC_01237]WRZ72869.1 hypothetical protein OG251_15225 [Streptomyces sp. NBC_01237]
MTRTPTTLPHDPYAQAVMAALEAEGLLDAAESWTAYDCDNGEVMMMEVVITLDEDRARAAGWTHGLVLSWNHAEGGWEWGPQGSGGSRDYVLDLIKGTLTPGPDDIVRAVQLLLDDAPVADRLPIAGTARPPAQTITPVLQAVLDKDGVDEELARALSAYA